MKTFKELISIDVRFDEYSTYIVYMTSEILLEVKQSELKKGLYRKKSIVALTFRPLTSRSFSRKTASNSSISPQLSRLATSSAIATGGAKRRRPDLTISRLAISSAESPQMSRPAKNALEEQVRDTLSASDQRRLELT
jgi:hypothetical protein